MGFFLCRAQPLLKPSKTGAGEWEAGSWEMVGNPNSTLPETLRQASLALPSL
jgi:hypothetical protein